jgi:hypothetical protein
MKDHAPAAADAVPFQITDDIVDVFLGDALRAGSQIGDHGDTRCLMLDHFFAGHFPRLPI